MKTIISSVIFFFSVFVAIAQTDSVKVELYPDKANLVMGYENRIKIIASEKYDQSLFSIEVEGCKVVKNKNNNTYLVRVPIEASLAGKEVKLTVTYKPKKKDTQIVYTSVYKIVKFDNSVRPVSR